MDAKTEHLLAEYLCDQHCWRVDEHEIKDTQYCPVADDMTCEECWARWINSNWWDDLPDE